MRYQKSGESISEEIESIPPLRPLRVMRAAIALPIMDGLPIKLSASRTSMAT